MSRWWCFFSFQHSASELILVEDEMTDTEDNEEEDLGVMDDQRSVILHLISQLKLGMDLTRVRTLYLFYNCSLFLVLLILLCVCVCACAHLWLLWACFAPVDKEACLCKGAVPESYGVLSPARQAFTWSDHITYFRDEGMERGKGKEKKRRKKPPNSSLFIISMSKQPYVMYVSHMYVKSGCTECLRNNNVNCIDEEGMYSS